MRPHFTAPSLPETYYSQLGVNENATSDEIRKAGRSRALAHHPDKGGAPRVFRMYQVAWDVLSNDSHRQDYDLWIARQRRPVVRRERVYTVNFEDIFGKGMGVDVANGFSWTSYTTTTDGTI